MPFTDIPEKIPFIIFLLLFVVIGIYPAWKKTAALIRKALHDIERGEIESGRIPQEDSALEGTTATPEMSDFESFIFWQLAQQQPKPVTRKQLNGMLHLEPADLKKALRSLAEKGLIMLEISSWFKLRYRLSASGYRYAVKQGFITPQRSMPNR